MDFYKISIKRSVEKDFRRIDKMQIPRLLNAIEALADNPFPVNCRKLVGAEHTYRLRLGDYRVIYFVLEDLRQIEIQRVAHRKEVYR